MSSTIAILGFGNPCRSDDAIGIYVIDQLKNVFNNHQTIHLFDMGTGAFEILFKLAGHHKFILIDAVINSNEPDGTIFKLPAEEVMSTPEEDPLVFLHSIKWSQALSYAKKIMQDTFPKDIEVYLIAIKNTKLEIELSEPVKAAGDQLVALLTQQFSTYN